MEVAWMVNEHVSLLIVVDSECIQCLSEHVAEILNWNLKPNQSSSKCSEEEEIKDRHNIYRPKEGSLGKVLKIGEAREASNP